MNRVVYINVCFGPRIRLRFLGFDDRLEQMDKELHTFCLTLHRLREEKLQALKVGQLSVFNALGQKQAAVCSFAHSTSRCWRCSTQGTRC